MSSICADGVARSVHKGIRHGSNVWLIGGFPACMRVPLPPFTNEAYTKQYSHYVAQQGQKSKNELPRSPGRVWSAQASLGAVANLTDIAMGRLSFRTRQIANDLKILARIEDGEALDRDYEADILSAIDWRGLG